MKKCNKCLVEKELDMFPKKGAKCKECVAEYKKEYALLNRDKVKQSQKKYYENNKEIVKEKVKEYNKNNIGKIKEYKDEYNKNNPNTEYHKDYRENNKELISIKRKEYYQKNKEKVREYNSENREYVNQKKRENREKNKDEYNRKWCEYVKNRKDNDPLYKLTCSIRTLISQSFKGQFTKKAKKTPISWSENKEDVYKLNHYTNFQPLFWKDNISKGNRWED